MISCSFALFIPLCLTLVTGCKEKPVIEVVEFPQSFADLVDKVQPAVVNISTTTTVRVPGHPFQHFFGENQNDPFGDFFENFFGAVPDRELKQRSLGTGFIIDKNGLIITNNHVVERADEIKVRLTDSREFKAAVIGRDPKTDLALIKISSPFEKLPVILLGDSDKIRVGDWVLAIGNPFGLEHTVTKGIISATGRVIGSGPYDNFLQTDAPINPGNSGGPLINLRGEVVGINTAIVPGGQGLGFAIPSNMAKAITAQLADKGVVTRGWLGVSIQKVTPELAASFGRQDNLGALVTDVVQQSPAERAGVKTGDIIVNFAGRRIKEAGDLSRFVAETQINRDVAIKLFRAGQEVNLDVHLEEFSEEKITRLSNAAADELGIELAVLDSTWRKKLGNRDLAGVVVVAVAAKSPAAAAGIESGDIIKEVNRRPIKTPDDFFAA
ncbi:MAG: Do family serine endopeptidase, partial [Deltaproteobacteria bacterium]